MRKTAWQRAHEIMERSGGRAAQTEITRNAGAKAVYDTTVAAISRLLPFHYTEFIDSYAHVGDLQNWARHMMDSQPPEFIVGDDYMFRWHIIPRNEVFNLYLHRMLRSDGDVMHDHPWDSTSFILEGGYIEHTPEGSFTRVPGDVVSRKAEDAHKIELIGGQPSTSLFFTGPKRREWGFHCPNGWVRWDIFTDGKHSGRSREGAGCGEP